MKNQLKQFTANDIYLFSNELNILNLKLKGIVSPLGLLSWLDNFSPNDYEIAIKIALNLQVFTTFEMEEIFEALFLNLLSDKKFSQYHNILISPISNVDKVKSSDAILYFFNKILTQSNKVRDRINLIEYTGNKYAKSYDKKCNYLKYCILKNLRIGSKQNIFYIRDKATLSKLIVDKHTTLILLDDFIGSGNTIEKYVNSLGFSENYLEKIHVIAIAGMKTGIDKLKERYNISIPEYNIYNKFIAENQYLNVNDIKLVKNLAENYTNSSSISNPLGYDKSEALVSFGYGTPNNTLQLIWEEKNKNVNNDKFCPLIPRFLTGKKHVSKLRRKEACFKLAKYYTIQRDKKHKGYNKISKFDYVKYFIIKSKKEEKDDFYICNTLGLFQSDYADLISKDLSKYLDESWNLRNEAIQYYNEIQKTLSCNLKRDKILTITPNLSVRYLPNSFKGQSKQ